MGQLRNDLSEFRYPVPVDNYLQSVVVANVARMQSISRRVLVDAKDPSEGVVIGQGPDWGAALNDIEWHDGDLLLIGSSESGPVARVFLGSRAAKIIRHTPVPVLVVPRGAAESHRH